MKLIKGRDLKEIIRGLAKPMDKDADGESSMQAMERNPDERYQSASELKQDLKKYLAGESVNLYEEDFQEALRRCSRKNSKILGAFFCGFGADRVVRRSLSCDRREAT